MSPATPIVEVVGLSSSCFTLSISMDSVALICVGFRRLASSFVDDGEQHDTNAAINVLNPNNPFPLLRFSADGVGAVDRIIVCCPAILAFSFLGGGVGGLSSSSGSPFAVNMGIPLLVEEGCESGRFFCRFRLDRRVGRVFGSILSFWGGLFGSFGESVFVVSATGSMSDDFDIEFGCSGI